MKKIIIFCWGLFVLAVAGVVSIFVLINNGKIGYMPPIEDLENPKNTVATELYSSDGKLLTTYYYDKTGNRLLVDYNDISPYFIKELVATEDVRFAEHSGIDIRALFRAIIKSVILLDKSSGGGSTLTQQLAKQLYSPSAANVFERALQKPIEWVIAAKLEKFYTKEEIITMYINQYDFSNNAVGIKTAAGVYFGKSPADLNIQENALLVGMCKNSSYFNPLRRPELCRQRRNVVLDQTQKAGFLTSVECDSLKKLPLDLDYHRIDHKTGLAPYFREYLRVTLTRKKPKRKYYASWQTQEFKDDSLAWENNPLFGWCHKNHKEDGSDYNLYSDGLKIYSTIDTRMQKYAEEAVYEHIGLELQQEFNNEKAGRKTAPYTDNLTEQDVNNILVRNMRQSERYRVCKLNKMKDKDILATFKEPVSMSVFTYSGFKDTIMTPLDSIKYHKFFLRSGFMSMDPINGHVKAYVGGISFNPFQYDMVTRGRRQVGSTIKPFLYSMAMENGFSPSDKVIDKPFTIMTETGETWSPRNAGNDADEGKVVNLRWGLAHSNNWISAYLMSHFSPYTFVKMLRSFGLQGPIDPVYSLCVGTCDATVAEMVSGYSAFANKGIRVKPMYVTRIEDNSGNVLADFSPQMKEVISEEASYKMLSMIRAVINEGTGIRTRFRYGIKAQMGGKTGTTQNNSDGWFMSVLPNLVSGVWVGGEERDIHFDGIGLGQGANMALPVFALYIKKVFADKDLPYYNEDNEFDVPQGHEYLCPISIQDSVVDKKNGNAKLLEETFDEF